jgi:hypothetical protein
MSYAPYETKILTEAERQDRTNYIALEEVCGLSRGYWQRNHPVFHPRLPDPRADIESESEDEASLNLG